MNAAPARLLALVLTLGLLGAACTDSSDGDGDAARPAAGPGDTDSDGQGGGELVDLGTFVGDSPGHIDPALNDEVDIYQVVNALFDGLTDIDASDPANARIVPHLAESYESNEDATVWTFTIRDDVTFSNGEPVLPSSFVRAWERATDPDVDAPYGYLFNIIEGGEEKLDGAADTLAGVVADDDAMTLTVSLSAPYADFDAVAGFQTFFPVPSEVDDLADPGEWENGLMVSNGPYVLESPRTDTEIVVVRNDRWAGDFNGETWPDRPERITFRVSADPDSAYNAFEAGEGDTASIPPGRAEQAAQDHGTTLDVDIFASSHFLFNEDSPLVGGDENELLRQAISQAIDRDEINEAVYGGLRTTATGITPPGIPGAVEGLCDYCAYDPAAAEAAFQAWQDAGNRQTEPIPIQFNSGSGHEPLVQIVIDNLDQVGIEAVADPRATETYFDDLAQGDCVMCRAGWTADVPTYDTFMYDMFHTDSVGGNNYGFADERFDALVDEARSTVDAEERAALFQQAEQLVLNDEIGVVPLHWYKGDYAYDQERMATLPQTAFQLILWEQIELVG